MEGHLMLLGHGTIGEPRVDGGGWLGGQVFYVVVAEGYLHLYLGADRNVLQAKVALTKRRVLVRSLQKAPSALFQLDVFTASVASQRFVFLASNSKSMDKWMHYLRQWKRFCFADPVVVDDLPEDVETLHLLLKHSYMADEDKFVSQQRRVW